MIMLDGRIYYIYLYVHLLNRLSVFNMDRYEQLSVSVGTLSINNTLCSTLLHQFYFVVTLPHKLYPITKHKCMKVF